MSEANELRNQNKQDSSEHKGVSDILGDAVHSALYSAVQEPISGVSQIVDSVAGTQIAKQTQFIDAPVQAQFGTADWHAQQVGSAVGMLAPFLLVHKGIKGALGTTAAAESAGLASARASLGMTMTEAGLTGFTYDAVLRPSDPNHVGNMSQFLMDRGTQGAIGAGTFMTLTGAGLGLNRLAGASAIDKSALVPILKNPIATGALSGIPAGLFAAEAHSLAHNGKFASASEVGQSVYGMTLIGGGFGAAHTLTARGADGSPSKLDSFTDKVRSAITPEAKPREGLSLLSGDKIGPEGAEHSVSGENKGTPEKVEGDQKGTPEKVEGDQKGTPEKVEKTDPPFDGSVVTNESLAELARSWGASCTPAKPKGDGGKKSAPVSENADAIVSPESTKPAATIKTEAVAPVETPKVAEIVNPAESTTSTGPVKPAETVTPAETVAPAETVTPAETITPSETVTPAETTTPSGKTGSTLDMLAAGKEKDTPVINRELRDDTTDGAVSTEPRADASAEPGGKRRSIKIPNVEAGKVEDLKAGIVLLNGTLKAQSEAKIAIDRAVFAEARAKDPLASDVIVQLATEARTTAEQAKQEADAKRKAFSDYVNEKGEGLESHLQEVAAQLKYPDRAREIVDRDFSLKQGKSLLESATADGATFEQQAAFEEFVRARGQKIRPELEKLAEETKNSDVARALLERSFAPRQVSIAVEDVGQQAAMNVGVKILTQKGGIDPAQLEKFAKDYGPAMEKHMRSAAEQLGFGVDAKLQIAEAYHGEAFKRGAELLKADPLDAEAIKQFAENDGKALEKPMAQAAVDLGFEPAQQLALREAYRGKETWIPVEGRDDAHVPVKPEQEDAFRMGVQLVKHSYENNAPSNYVDFMRAWMKSPDNANLIEPLNHYAELSGDPHMKAFIREMQFPTENMTVSGKPASIQLGDLLGGSTPEAVDRQNRFRDFVDLTETMKNAPDAQASQARQEVFDWLNRNEDLYDAALRMGEQSADSRVVGALDSYFGTENLKPFIEARAKYEKVSNEITDNLIERYRKPGYELFNELAPPPPETPRLWGGEPNISNSRQALRINKLEDGTVVAEFNPERNPEHVKTVTDTPEGKRTVEYADGSQFIQLPEGYDIDVKPDGSWSSKFSNGNSISENASGPIDKVVYENGAETVMYRDGEVRRTGVEDQTASKKSDGTIPGADDMRVEERAKDATEAAKPTAGRMSEGQVSALVEKMGSSDYNEAVSAAIVLKNGFGSMNDAQFTRWLNFAFGSHPDSFSNSGKQIPNWPDLGLRSEGQVLMRDHVQNFLRGGETPAQQSSPEGMQRAAVNREMLRQFLDAPEGRAHDLTYPRWMVRANQLPPESLPQNVLRDISVRFKDSLPADVAQYLKDNPLKPKTDRKGNEVDYRLADDNIPNRLRVLNEVLQYAPKEIQQKLLELGQQDGRALSDIMQFIKPGDRPQPVEYKELLALTVPQARDIYTIRTLLASISDAAYVKDAAAKTTNENFAVKASVQVMPENTKAQERITELVSGLAKGEYRAPFVRRDGDGDGNARRDSRKKDDRQRQQQPKEETKTDEELAKLDGEEESGLNDTQLTGPDEGRFSVEADWEQSRGADENEVPELFNDSGHLPGDLDHHQGLTGSGHVDEGL